MKRHKKFSMLGITMFMALSHSASGQSTNLITNPGFETQPLTPAWVPYGNNGTLIAVADPTFDGAYAVKSSNRTQSYAGPAQTITPFVFPGETLYATAYARAGSMGSHTLQLGLKVVDGAGTRYLVLDSTLVRDTGWYKLSAPINLTITGTLSLAQLYVGGPAAGVDLYVDNVSLVEPEPYTVTPSSPDDFVRPQGTRLVVGPSSEPIRLQGVNFNAYCDDSETAETVYMSNNHGMEDFQRVAAMGLNVVRLNLTYKLLENDAQPYVYLERGFEYIDQHIVAARNAGVYLILSMMGPPGGYQSYGYTGTFWDTGSPYQDRLISLWQAIAERYKDEPWVVAYDLINEPSPNSNAQYIAYIEDLVAAIRLVDQNHLLDVQEAFVSDSDHFLLADDKILYDFHSYEPWEFANQLQYRDGGHGDGGVYPDPNVYFFPYNYSNGALLQNPIIPAGTTGWSYYQGSMLTVTDPDAFAATPTLISSSSTGKIWFDDFIVEEFDPSGNFLRRVHNVDLEKPPSTWYLLESWDPFLAFTDKFTGRAISGTGKRTVESTGHSGKASISISSVTGKYIVQSPRLMFAVKQNHKYRISGWVKGDSVGSGSGSFGLELKKFKSYEVRQPLTRESLEQRYRAFYLDYYQAAGVPVNVGEFGVSPRAFLNNKGGERLVFDTLSIFAAYGVNAQYFDYHSQDFGVYSNLYGWPDSNYLNTSLVSAFQAAAVLDSGTPAPTGEPTPAPSPEPIPDPSRAPSPTPAPTLIEVIVDNQDPGFSTTGTWTESSAGGEYLASSLVATAQGSVARWTAALPVGGTYQVYGWWAASSNRPSAAPYSVQHVGGSATVTVNQQLNGNKWNLLGTYTMDAGSVQVQLTRPTGEANFTSADAVRFVRVP